jgi:hypothetical protein
MKKNMHLFESQLYKRSQSRFLVIIQFFLLVFDKENCQNVISPKPRTGSKCEDLKSSPVRIGGFEMTSHANKSLLN